MLFDDWTVCHQGVAGMQSMTLLIKELEATIEPQAGMILPLVNKVVIKLEDTRAVKVGETV
eukprot:gene14009-16561_t